MFFPLPRQLRDHAAARRTGPARGLKDAMAVYTDVSAEDLSAFLAGYDLGELLSYKGIAEGVENSNFLVHTGSGYYILTLYEKRVAAGDVPFFLALMEHLAARGINCPQPVKARGGATLGQLAGRPAAMVTFLEGMWMRRPDATHCTAVGEALARMHLAGADFPEARNALSVTDWRPLFGAVADRADSLQHGLRRPSRRSSIMLERAWPARPAARRHPRRPVPRQRVLSRRASFPA